MIHMYTSCSIANYTAMRSDKMRRDVPFCRRTALSSILLLQIYSCKILSAGLFCYFGAASLKLLKKAQNILSVLVKKREKMTINCCVLFIT